MTGTRGAARPATASVAGVLDALTLTEIEPDRFSATCVEMNLEHLFGGQVAAQALSAAARTVPGKTANSLHAYFLRAGHPREPIEYVVTRIRDGRRLASRAVSATQGGTLIATVMCSFAETSGNLTHGTRAPAGPPPESVPTLQDAAGAWGGLGASWAGLEAIEIRVDPRRAEGGFASRCADEDPGDLVWLRAAAELPDVQVLHQAMFVFASDTTLLAATLAPHGVPVGQEEIAGATWDGTSLDHAIWFHRPLRSDDWLLYAQRSPVAHAGRALATAQVFSTQGELVATVVQEGLMSDLPIAGAPHVPERGQLREHRKATP